MKVIYKETGMLFMTALWPLLLSMIFLVNRRDPMMKSIAVLLKWTLVLCTDFYLFIYLVIYLSVVKQGVIDCSQ